MVPFTRLSVFALTLGLLLAGCDMVTNADDETASAQMDDTYHPSSIIDDPPEDLQVGVFTVCKAAPDAPDHAFSFSVTAEGPHTDDATLVPGVDLTDGECAPVYTLPDGSEDADDVTVTEQIPSGWRLDSVRVAWIDDTGTVTTREATGPTVTERVTPNGRGVRATYYNAPAETDTVRGGEGCTPGAWKNRLRRLDRWPVPQETLVADVWNVPASLEDATLLDALRFGGGPSFEHKVRILLRAATAAYLNAHTIDYDLTPEAVVDQVNAAIASGDSGAVIDLAEALDAFNNQDCPITERNYEG